MLNPNLVETFVIGLVSEIIGIVSPELETAFSKQPFSPGIQELFENEGLVGCDNCDMSME